MAQWPSQCKWSTTNKWKRSTTECWQRSLGPWSNSIGAHCCSLAHNVLCENVGKTFGKDAYIGDSQLCVTSKRTHPQKSKETSVSPLAKEVYTASSEKGAHHQTNFVVIKLICNFIMYLLLLCPTLPGWWWVGILKGIWPQQHALWEGQLPCMEEFYCTFVHMCSTDLTKKTAPV